MVKVGKKIVKFRVPILILSIILLIPAVWGYVNTRINYDVLTYLPEDIETMQGQEIMTNDFGIGAFSMLMVDGMEDKEIVKLKEKVEKVDGVENVLWYDSLADISVPQSVLPSKLYDEYNTEDGTMMAVFFKDGTSSDETMKAITEIRKITGEQCFLSGMSAIVEDTKELAEKETPLYVLIAVVLSALVLAITMESIFVPVLFLLSIGIAIVYNLGTNVFFGEISYITKALAAVLQLAVTMDYSIFLWHSYEEQKKVIPNDNNKAMANAITATVSSIVGSSITTVAGFIALCFMTFTLGLDMGVVMAKGVVFGVIACVTVLPAMVLIFDKALVKTKHKPLIPDFKKLPKFITKHYPVFIIIFLVLIFPAFYGQKNTNVYYDLTLSLPESLESVKAQNVISEDYNLGSANIVLISSDTPDYKVSKLLDDIKGVDGVQTALGLQTVLNGSIPNSFIPDDLTKELKTDKYEMLIFMSEYKTGSDEANNQCNEIEKIIKNYSKDGMLVGEAACTRDLIKITDKDFTVVNSVSIVLVFIIIALVFKSISIPIVLVALIEFAIFINMGIPYYTGATLPFIASIVIGTIQLGATVDYAILMTNRYKSERSAGHEKKIAATNALQATMKSIIISACTFFGATFGVGAYSNIDMISSLCILMSRGAFISMFCVICILPAFFIIFDKFIIKGSYKFLEK